MLLPLVTMLTMVLGGDDGAVLQVDLRWDSGYCHVIAAKGALLVQVEEYRYGTLGWPTRGFEHVWVFWRDWDRVSFSVPCCSGGSWLAQVRRVEALGIGLGYGRHWGSGAGYWWLVVPPWKWELPKEDEERERTK
jgi:hypothetical protein